MGVTMGGLTGGVTVFVNPCKPMSRVIAPFITGRGPSFILG